MHGVKDLVVAYAQKRGISNVQAKAEVEAMVDCLKDLVVKGGISLKGLFTIKHHVRKGRTGKRPGTDITYTTEDKTVLKITTGSVLDKELNG